MDYSQRIGELLDRYTDLKSSVTIVQDELILLPKYSVGEWMNLADGFLYDCEQFADLVAHDNSTFAERYYRYFEHQDDVRNERAATGSHVVGRTGRELFSGMADSEDGILPISEPFDGCFKYIEKIGDMFEILCYLKEEYGSANTHEVARRKRDGIFGDFHFRLDDEHMPMAVEYKGKAIDISAAPLKMFFIVMELCFYGNKTISCEQIKKRLSEAKVAPEDFKKYQSEVNKKVLKQTGIKQFIFSPKDGYRKLRI